MSWNLNNNKNEYQLHGSITTELINMFGIQATYLKTEHMSVDEVLGDIKNYAVTKSEQVFDVMLLPETPEGFDKHDNLLTNFGIFNLDALDFFISVEDMQKLYGKSFNKCVGDLLVFPSKKVMEITNCIAQVPGINNMFLYDNDKNVYKLTCKTYAHNRDEITIDKVDVPNDEILSFDNLDGLFNIERLEQDKQKQDNDSPLIKDIDPIFGELG